MGLFDDILPKKTQETTLPSDPLAGSSGNGSGSTGSSGGQPPQDDTTTTPVVSIQKTEEGSLFDTIQSAPSVTKDISSPIDMTPTLHAEENSLSVLVQEDTQGTGVQNQKLEILSESTLSEESVASSLFTPDTQTVTEKVEEPSSVSSLFSLGADGANETESINDTVSSKESLLHPREFIERSISEIDEMISSIETARLEKVEEASGYANEKTRLEELEKNTLEEAKKLEEEKSHAEHVKSLLQNELSGSLSKNPEGTETPESVINFDTVVPPESPRENPLPESLVTGEATVETTLTGLAVQNTVTETIDGEKNTTEIIAVSAGDALIAPVSAEGTEALPTK